MKALLRASATRRARTRTAALAALALIAVPVGCATAVAPHESAPDTQGAEPDIAGGKPINSKGDAIATKVPWSTVALKTPIPGEFFVYHACTGVLVANNMVLTAAHCMVDSTTQVGLYNNTSTQPATWVNVSSAVTPPGVKCPDPLPLDAQGNPDDSGCYSNGVLMDLAVVTLATDVTTVSPKYRPVSLGPCGQYAANYTKSAWEVGAGKINGVQNDAQILQWVAMTLPPAEYKGGIWTAQVYSQLGDSGGPVFQLEALGGGGDAGTDSGAAGADAGAVIGDLVVVGITHGSTSSQSIYTSVESSLTCMWVLMETLTPAQPPIIIAGDKVDKVDLGPSAPEGVRSRALETEQVSSTLGE